MVKHSSKKSSFVLPRRTVQRPPRPGEQEAAKKRKAEAIEKEKATREATEKRLQEEAARGPSKKELKREVRRKRLVEEGKIEQSDLEVKQLLKVKLPVVVAFEDCQDEAELRNIFHGQGTAGWGAKFFSASKFKFKYLLAKDGTPVAQVVKAYTVYGGGSSSGQRGVSIT
ncbi:unnamed protein product [Polarella glacialis]|uniref:Uncharacterized protein n=1 Tax=Polarella glacialis TaxID=89957 RepID=A0A813J9Y9_POLGL|nr:unnamed protein product [Polarella glacialis]CAE8671323.1 unnamed protein product [Polarella glacialis]